MKEHLPGKTEVCGFVRVKEELSKTGPEYQRKGLRELAPELKTSKTPDLRKEFAGQSPVREIQVFPPAGLQLGAPGSEGRPGEGPARAILPSPCSAACSAPGSSAGPIGFERKAGLYFQLRSQGLNVLCNLGDIWQWASGQPRSVLDLLSFSRLMDSFAGKESRRLGVRSDSERSVFSTGSLKK